MSTKSSSTGGRPFNDTDTGQQHSGDNQELIPQPKEGWTFKPENIFTLGVLVITGISGYFSAIYALKDDINFNKSEILVLKEKANNFEGKFKVVNIEINKILGITTDTEVIKFKVLNNKNEIEINKKNINKISNSRMPYYPR